ncbi:S-norcoclaurine synthase 1 [Acorus gramineus]|uniref:S-norcoclaurine synthase 1 n=1 Tax=Acorus gramineus TaxID=55184 RepID=A0AAV9B8B2_ACOGR|nr:S-norcoclaurine synthase 1 [Acorus gramineus]
MESAQKTETLGGSLRVDNVQALASKPLQSIPDRYVRPELDADPTLHYVQQEIPTVDLSKLLDQRSSHDELKNLHSACQDWGFFHLVNHGVSGEVIEKMKMDVKEFFRQPLEVKEAHAQLPGDIEGYGQAFVVSDEQKLDWADMVFLKTRPVQLRNFKFWPTQPPSFRETLDHYTLEIQKVADELISAMAKNLGVSAETLIEKLVFQQVRINYYPSCPQSDKVLGLSSHSDTDTLTILLQINEVQGLQIKKDDSWVPIAPLPDSFIINIGDVMEILSNGKYKSINHRGTIDPLKERLSIATFHSPNYDASIGPLKEITRDGEEHYETMEFKEMVKIRLSSKLNEKDYMETMKLN